jgi:hypothetical protein
MSAAKLPPCKPLLETHFAGCKSFAVIGLLGGLSRYDLIMDKFVLANAGCAIADEGC